MSRVGLTLVVVCPDCGQKNRTLYHLLRKTNCGRCHARLLRPDRPQGYVYLLRAGHYYKIGKAVDLKKRMDQIRLSLPFKADLIHSIEAFFPSEVELHWHKRFADKRQNGEWFVLTDEEVAEFSRVSRM